MGSWLLSTQVIPVYFIRYMEFYGTYVQNSFLDLIAIIYRVTTIYLYRLYTEYKAGLTLESPIRDCDYV